MPSRRALAGDARSACGCRSGRSRCGVSCADGPRNLYRGEGDARDGAGSQHATQSNAGFAVGRLGQAFAFGGQLAQRYVTLPPGALDFGDGEITGALRDPTATPVYLGVGRCVAGAPGSNGDQDGSTWLDGRVDEVAVLPRALSETELLAVAQGRCAL